MDNKQYEVICKKTWFKLLVDGVSKFYTRHEVLEKYLKLLKTEGFDTYYFNCNDWENINSFSKDYIIRINKGNLESNILPDKEGYIFVFQNFEEYFSNYFKEAISLINIVEELSMHYLLFGKKLIVFLNTNGNTVNKKLLQMDDVLITPIRMIDSDFSESIGRRNKEKTQQI